MSKLLVAIHLAFVRPALVLGPFVLWARKGSRQHAQAVMPGSR